MFGATPAASRPPIPWHKSAARAFSVTCLSVDGKPAHRLDGCLDVDLKAYVRAVGLAVERLDHNYTRITEEAACVVEIWQTTSRCA